MQLTGIWSDDNKLRAVFSWLTRIGAAPKFGSRPIGWYQQCQAEVIGKLERELSAQGYPGGVNLRASQGWIYAQREPGSDWHKLTSILAIESF